MKATIATAANRLLELAEIIESREGFASVIASLRAGHGGTLDGVWGSSCALCAATLARHAPGLLVVVCAHPSDLDGFTEDLGLFTARASDQFPAREDSPLDDDLADESLGKRLSILKSLATAGRAEILVTCIQAIMEPVVAPELLAGQTRGLKVGDTIDCEELLQWLVQSGFHNTPAVQLPGEFSRRGGILDVFASDWQEAVRLEFFGDQIESIRQFELGTQRSLARLERIDLTALDPRQAGNSYFSDHLPPTSWVLLVEPGEIEDQARQFGERREEKTALFTPSDTLNRLYQFPSVVAGRLVATSMETTCQMRIESVERFSGDVNKVRHELASAGEGNDVYVVAPTAAEGERLQELFAATGLATSGRLHFPVGRLGQGFRLAEERIVLVSAAELFQRQDVVRHSRRRLGKVIDSFLELREGDYVVHLAHGIGRFRGLRVIEKGDQAEEHLIVEFDEQTKIYVPVSRIELVQKYVGGTKSRPKLAKIGGKLWGKQKEAAQEAILDMAAELLEMQAARKTRPGITFPTDSDWQREFDAAFPYQETPDQLSSIAACKQDMQSPRPMDRLLCGDVGFGKTEVAMRCAFKAVDAGYQVAVLVPTTLLADQHGRTFRERMSEFPFKISVLSRFCTAGEQKQILASMQDGSVDIVIGTHRLAQVDVQFHNLGLVIIDEEQRFGVGIKERLKAYRHIVDVLTMTATPIPRTLHMSLMGLRDISSLETPPAERLAVETRVTRFDHELIRNAMLRELNRDGQAYFIHNRVEDIDIMARRLREIIPEATIAIAHGQMHEDELEDAMLAFVHKKCDILLATTIVESGLDIPNANTMFINDADRHGLADLHQLRGRVGRYHHRAYCYMLIDPNKALTTTAARRLTAIEEFSNMGAGFALSMRDLEIRGAGNILGTQQSGHIAAIGYELYCTLLEGTVRKLQNLPDKPEIDVHVDLPGEAYLPRGYVADHRLKIDLYRRFSRAATLAELSDLKDELADRFGPPPEQARRWFSWLEIRVLAHAWGITQIHLENEFLVLRYQHAQRMRTLAARHTGQLRIADALSAYYLLGKDVKTPDELIGIVKSLLRQN